MPERRGKFTPEFRDEAVKIVIETSRPIAEDALPRLRRHTRHCGAEVRLSLDAPRKCVLSASRDARMPF